MLKNKNNELEQKIQKIKNENSELRNINERYRSLYVNEKSHNEILKKLIDKKDELHSQAIKRYSDIAEQLMSIPIDELGKQDDVEIIFCKTYRGGFKLYHHGQEIDLSKCSALDIRWRSDEIITIEIGR